MSPRVAEQTVEANRYHLRALPAWYQAAEDGGKRPGTAAAWSGPVAPPGVGETIHVPNFGPAKVAGYFVETGYLGLELHLASPPAWWVKQNGGRAKAARKVARLYGVECYMPRGRMASPPADFARPEGLSDAGTRAYDTIVRVLAEHDALQSGGCRVFYSPAEWKARGERYGQDAELIVIYDGGTHRAFMTLDAGRYELHEAMRAALEAAGCWAEECTTWYGAVYAKEGSS